jgi:hypothetical protein
VANNNKQQQETIMSGFRLNKEYTATVTLPDDSFITYQVEVQYEDDDEMCIPDIDVELTPTSAVEGMSADFEDDIGDAINTYFTKDACNTEDGQEVVFLYDTIADKLEVIEGDVKVHTQNVVDKALEQIKKDVEAGDLTAIEELLKLADLRLVKRYLAED